MSFSDYWNTTQTMQRHDASLILPKSENIAKSLKQTIRRESKLCSRVKHQANDLITGKKQPNELDNMYYSFVKQLATIKESHEALSRDISDLCSRARFIEEPEIESIQQRLSALIADYLFRQDFKGAASALAKHAEVEGLCDFEDMSRRATVAGELREGNTESAISWCEDNAARLKKLGSPFRARLAIFELRQRVAERDEAVYKRSSAKKDVSAIQAEDKQQSAVLLAWARREVAPAISSCPPNHRTELMKQFQALCGAAMFPPSSEGQMSRYKFDTDAVEEGEKLATLFSTLHEGSSLQHGLLTSLFAMGCTAVRTQLCTPTPGAACPTCNPNVHPMAKTLPLSEKVVSRVICRYSGRPMTDSNPPLMLPNGNVYSTETVHKLAEVNDGRVIDPFTKDEYPLADAVKVFIG